MPEPADQPRKRLDEDRVELQTEIERVRLLSDDELDRKLEPLH